MELEKLKREYLRELVVQGYAEGTVRYRRTYLDQFLFFLQLQGEVEGLTSELVYGYQARLVKHGYASLTVHSKLSVLRGFLSWLLKENHLLVDLAASITFPKRVLSLPQRILSKSEVRGFL